MRGRQIALGVVFLLLVSVPGLSAATTTRSWQDGELLSRKTVPMGRTFLKNRYVYRVRGLNREYLVESQIPLELDLYVPLKFSPDRNQIIIQDSDGHQYKVHILQRAAVSLRQ
jgi:hypothetical protein